MTGNCKESIGYLEDHNLFGREEQYILDFIRNNEKEFKCEGTVVSNSQGEQFQHEDLDHPWCLNWKRLMSKPENIRKVGTTINMKTYQLFNSVTGEHEEYNTLEEAKAAMIALVKSIVKDHRIDIAVEISNEHGHSGLEYLNEAEKLEIQ